MARPSVERCIPGALTSLAVSVCQDTMHNQAHLCARNTFPYQQAECKGCGAWSSELACLGATVAQKQSLPVCSTTDNAILKTQTIHDKAQRLGCKQGLCTMPRELTSTQVTQEQLRAEWVGTVCCCWHRDSNISESGVQTEFTHL